MWSRPGLLGLFVAACLLAAGLAGGMFASTAPTTPAVPVTAPTAAETPTAPADPTPANPAVEPGKVRWHTSTAAAFAAARESKKPVLVFQMMGELDRLLC